jgi:hypothetical protein
MKTGINQNPTDPEQDSPARKFRLSVSETLKYARALKCIPDEEAQRCIEMQKKSKTLLSRCIHRIEEALSDLLLPLEAFYGMSPHPQRIHSNELATHTPTDVIRGFCDCLARLEHSAHKLVALDRAILERTIKMDNFPALQINVLNLRSELGALLDRPVLVTPRKPVLKKRLKAAVVSAKNTAAGKDCEGNPPVKMKRCVKKPPEPLPREEWMGRASLCRIKEASRGEFPGICDEDLEYRPPDGGIIEPTMNTLVTVRVVKRGPATVKLSALEPAPRK